MVGHLGDRQRQGDRPACGADADVVTIGGADLAALGIPSEDEYRDAYCRRTGRQAIPNWDFYMAYNMFRLAGIVQGIMGRVIAGTANDPQARLRGERARPLAEAGWSIAQQMKR